MLVQRIFLHLHLNQRLEEKTNKEFNLYLQKTMESNRHRFKVFDWTIYQQWMKRMVLKS